MGRWGPLILPVLLAATVLCCYSGGAIIPTTLEGPFSPVTVPTGFRGHAVDLPESDPRVQKNWVSPFQPEQISVSLSATEDSIYISWVTGWYILDCDDQLFKP